MHGIVYILFVSFVLQIVCVPSGFKINSARGAENDEYPFIVSLERRILLAFDGRVEVEKNVHICTCVAISPSWTLTAGHCIKSAAPIKDLSDNLRIQTVIRYGSLNGSMAEVLSTVLHSSFQDPLLKMQNNIGLLRTEIIRLKYYAHISEIDINTLGGQEVTLAGHRNTNISLPSVKRMPLQLLNVLIVRLDNKNNSTFPVKCVARSCLLSSIICDGGSGGPMLHSTGVIGINTMSLENVKWCSEINKNQLISIEVITPMKAHIKWINNTIIRDVMPFSI